MLDPDVIRELNELVLDCETCRLMGAGDTSPENHCPHSDRGCGHHCNHSWSHDVCCWCGVTLGEVA